jgi:ATP-dependent Clp protease adaptor protein ClpS
VARHIRQADAADVRVCAAVSSVLETQGERSGAVSDGTGPDNAGDVKEHVEEKVTEPEMFRVVLHNDDYTTMEFVVEVLMGVFHRTIVDATRIMLDVHQKGRGVVGTYTYDIANTKVTTVREMARRREFPLRCTIEPA